jgi:hypothetical protein
MELSSMTRSGGINTLVVGAMVEDTVVDMEGTCQATAGMVVDMVITLVTNMGTVADMVITPVMDMSMMVDMVTGMDMVVVVEDTEDTAVAEDMEGTVVAVVTVVEATWELDTTEVGINSSEIHNLL